MSKYSPTFPHGAIQEILPDIFFVTGASILQHEENFIQKSNNMTIVRNGNELTLINTLRLDENGLQALEKLGIVSHVVRLGAFHDRNDGYYINRYKAKLWACEGMHFNNNLKIDFLIKENEAAPIKGAAFFEFKTTKFPEAIMHISLHGGILIACDSIKNWTKIDEYFSEKTAKDFLEQGLIQPVSIDKIWLGAMNPGYADFERLKSLQFKHFFSAHGEPIIDEATAQIMPVLEKFSIKQ